MGERDAFGREKDDDSLKDLGWAGSSGDPASAASPTPAAPPRPAPVASAPMTNRDFTGASIPSTLPNIPGGRRSGGGMGRVIGIIIAFAIIGGIVAAVIPAIDSVKDTVNSVTNSFSVPDVTIPGVSVENGTTTVNETDAPETPKPTKPPVGLQPGSMLRSDVLVKVLPKIRKAGANIELMRIDATRISATIVTTTHKRKVATFDYAGTANVISQGASSSNSPTFRVGELNSKAPARAVARACAILKRPASKVGYVVVSRLFGSFSINVYFNDGKFFRASADGRNVTRVS